MKGQGSGGSAEGDELFSIEDWRPTPEDDNLIGSNVDN